MKHEYKIIINSVPKKSDIYYYNHGKTKDIKIKIAQNKVIISTAMTIVRTFEQLINSDNEIFTDAIKKSLLIHIIKYSKSINITNIKVIIDGEERVVFLKSVNEDNPPIYCLVNKKLCRGFPQEWNNDTFIQALLNQPLPTYDERLSSLYATICSKSKDNEVERFIYLYMAISGMYEYFSDLVSNFTSTDLSTDCLKRQTFICLNGWGKDCIYGKESTRIAKEIINILKCWDGTPITKYTLENGIHKRLAKAIEKKLVHKNSSKPYDISAYGYLTIELACYYRFKIFHGNKPLPFLCFANQYDFKCLKIINSLMEDYIQKNLYRWFDAEYVDTYLKDCIEEIIHSLNYEKKLEICQS